MGGEIPRETKRSVKPDASLRFSTEATNEARLKVKSLGAEDSFGDSEPQALARQDVQGRTRQLPTDSQQRNNDEHLNGNTLAPTATNEQERVGGRSQKSTVADQQPVNSLKADAPREDVASSTQPIASKSPGPEGQVAAINQPSVFPDRANTTPVQPSMPADQGSVSPNSRVSEGIASNTTFEQPQQGTRSVDVKSTSSGAVQTDAAPDLRSNSTPAKNYTAESLPEAPPKGQNLQTQPADRKADATVEPSKPEQKLPDASRQDLPKVSTTNSDRPIGLEKQPDQTLGQTRTDIYTGSTATNKQEDVRREQSLEPIGNSTQPGAGATRTDFDTKHPAIPTNAITGTRTEQDTGRIETGKSEQTNKPGNDKTAKAENTNITAPTGKTIPGDGPSSLPPGIPDSLLGIKGRPEGKNTDATSDTRGTKPDGPQGKAESDKIGGKTPNPPGAADGRTGADAKAPTGGGLGDARTGDDNKTAGNRTGETKGADAKTPGESKADSDRRVTADNKDADNRVADGRANIDGKQGIDSKSGGQPSNTASDTPGSGATKTQSEEGKGSKQTSDSTKDGKTGPTGGSLGDGRTGDTKSSTGPTQRTDADTKVGQSDGKSNSSKVDSDVKTGSGRQDIDTKTGSTRTDIDTKVGSGRSDADTKIGSTRTDIDTKVGSNRPEIDTKTGSTRTDIDTKVGSGRPEIDTKAGSTRTDIDTKVGSSRSEIDSRVGAPRTDVDTKTGSTPNNRIETDQRIVKGNTTGGDSKVGGSSGSGSSGGTGIQVGASDISVGLGTSGGTKGGRSETFDPGGKVTRSAETNLEPPTRQPSRANEGQLGTSDQKSERPDKQDAKADGKQLVDPKTAQGGGLGDGRTTTNESNDSRTTRTGDPFDQRDSRTPRSGDAGGTPASGGTSIAGRMGKDEKEPPAIKDIGGGLKGLAEHIFGGDDRRPQIDQWLPGRKTVRLEQADQNPPGKFSEGRADERGERLVPMSRQLDTNSRLGSEFVLTNITQRDSKQQSRKDESSEGTSVPHLHKSHPAEIRHDGATHGANSHVEDESPAHTHLTPAELILADIELIDDSDEATGATKNILASSRKIGPVRTRTARNTESNDDEESVESATGADEEQSRYQYVVRPGDTIDSIAVTELKNINLAPLLFAINRQRIQFEIQNGHSVLVAGSVINLPTPREIAHYTSQNTAM